MVGRDNELQLRIKLRLLPVRLPHLSALLTRLHHYLIDSTHIHQLQSGYWHLPFPQLEYTPTYPNPYHAYMTPAPHTMTYYTAYTHPQSNSPAPLATPANSQVTQISQQTTSFEFRHYNPASTSRDSRYNPS